MFYKHPTGKSFYSDVAVIRRRAEGDAEPGNDALLKDIHACRARFLAAMDDDFNSGAASSELFELIRVLNKFVDQSQLEETAKGKPELVASFERGVTTLRELTAILGLFRQPSAKQSSSHEELVGQLVNLFIELRQAARAKKDFATSDKIRQSLGAIGVTLEDRKGVTEWRIG